MEPLGGFPGVQAAHHLLEPTGTGKSLLCYYSVIKTEQQGCPESTKKTLSMTGEARKRSPRELILPRNSHSRILAWKIPWTKGAWWLQSMGSQGVGHDWATELNWTDFCFIEFPCCVLVSNSISFCFYLYTFPPCVCFVFVLISWSKNLDYWFVNISWYAFPSLHDFSHISHIFISLTEVNHVIFYFLRGFLFCLWVIEKLLV